MELILPRNRHARLAVWALLAAAILVSFFCFFYEDMQTIYDNSVVFWRGLLHGRSPLEFYEYSVEMTRSPWGANYNFFPYIITCLWSLPSMAYCRIVGMDYFYSMFGRMWFKLLFLLALLLATYLITRILRLLGKDKKVQGATAFVFLSSVIVINCVMVMPNIEILALCFMLGGIYNLMRGRQVPFLVLFAMATACKSFALFLVLPLVLLVEKNVLRALLKMASSVSILVVEKLIFSGSTTYASALGTNTKMAIELLSGPTFARTGFFIIAFVFCLVMCYMHDAPQLLEAPAALEKSGASHFKARGRTPGFVMRAEDMWLVLYVCAFVFGMFVVCVELHGYWAVLVMPFLVPLFARVERLAPLLVILEIVTSIAYVLYLAFYEWGLNGDKNIVAYGVLSRLGIVPPAEYVRYGPLKEFLGSTPLGTLRPVYVSVFVACMLLLLILCAPPVIEKIKDRVIIDESVALVVPWLRVMALAVFLGMVLYARLAWAQGVTFSNLASPGEPSSHSLLVEGESHVLAQKLDLKDMTKVDTLTIMMDTSEKSRINFTQYAVELWDATDQRSVWSKAYGACLIEEDTYSKIRIDAPVDSQHEYELRLLGVAGTGYNLHVTLAPYVVSTAGNTGLYYDGAPIEGTLQYAIR